MAGLTDLRLPDRAGNPGVTDAGLESLALLKGLRAVSLSGTAVTREGAARLKKALPRCRVGR